jgi:hypothetical protein
VILSVCKVNIRSVQFTLDGTLTHILFRVLFLTFNWSSKFLNSSHKIFSLERLFYIVCQPSSNSNYLGSKHEGH